MKKYNPPVPLTDLELPFFDGIIQSRPTFTDIDLLHCCNLARTLSQIECETALLDLEGSIVSGRKNPRCDLIDRLTKTALSLSSLIGADAANTMGRSRDQRIKNAKAQEAREAFDYDEDNNLIARPVELTEH